MDNCVVLFGKKNTISELAYNFLEKKIKIVKYFFEDDIFDEEELKKINFTYLISFLNPRIIKSTFLLEKRCINFHPSVPKYRGVCGASLAIFNDDTVFGATCHIINNKIDEGDIFFVKEIEMYKDEDCYSLGWRSKVACLELLYKFVNFILKNNKLPEINKDYTWGKSLMTKKKFREMITFKKEEISDNIDHFKKIEKSVKNKYFPGPYIIN